MKTLQQETRALTVKETKALKKIRNTNENVLRRGYKWPNVIGALILAAVCFYGATWTRFDLITFLLGVSAFFCMGYVFFMPFEAFKDIRRAKRNIRIIEDVLAKGTVDVFPVKATQIALAKEYEDEGDLYIVEMDNKNVLYIWDNDHNLRKGFPSLEFEIYSDEFYALLGRQVNPVSEKIKPIVVEAEAKWKYLEKSGSPEHLEIQRKSFDKLIEKMSSYA